MREAEEDVGIALACLEKLELELQKTFDENPSILKRPIISDASWFLMGAVKRTIAQSAGFRSMIAAHNSPSAMAVLRMQADTAMRINGLRYVEDREYACKFLMNGGRFSDIKMPDGVKLRDAQLKALLAKTHEWVAGLYDEASEYVHLTSTHMREAITAQVGNLVFFNFGPKDPTNSEPRRAMLTRAFYAVTELAIDLIYEDMPLVSGEQLAAMRSARANCRPIISST